MTEPIYVFLDFDDTLSDFRAHGAQYVGELACRLSTGYGGEAESWEAAIRPALQESMGRYAIAFTGNPLAGYNRWLREERVRVTTDIFERVKRPLPRHESLEELAARVQFDALTACDALLPGAADALRELEAEGVRIQMASSQESEYLLAALIGAGIEELVENRFGPDLLDCAKEGPEFYERIFESCGIHPRQAIVVDDQAMCLDYAEEVGALVVQARIIPSAVPPEYPIVLGSVPELPGLVRRLSR